MKGEVDCLKKLIDDLIEDAFDQVWDEEMEIHYWDMLWLIVIAIVQPTSYLFLRTLNADLTVKKVDQICVIIMACQWKFVIYLV